MDDLHRAHSQFWASGSIFCWVVGVCVMMVVNLAAAAAAARPPPRLPALLLLVRSTLWPQLDLPSSSFFNTPRSRVTIGELHTQLQPSAHYPRHRQRPQHQRALRSAIMASSSTWSDFDVSRAPLPSARLASAQRATVLTTIQNFVNVFVPKQTIPRLRQFAEKIRLYAGIDLHIKSQERKQDLVSK